MSAFDLVNSIDDVMVSFNKPYNERTGFLIALMGIALTELKYGHPKAYAATEKYIEQAVAALIVREQQKLERGV